MKSILVIGKGGREHAIAWKLSKSSKVKEIFVIPGNSAINGDKIKSISNIDSMDFDALMEFVIDKKIDWTIVGPEVELEAGIVDVFEERGLKIFGPNKYTSQVESSKSFSKNKMIEFGIPTAIHKVFDNSTDSIEYLRACKYPIVIKEDGLAAGKGVTIPNSFREAEIIINKIFNSNISKKSIVIEECLVGEEFSLLAFVNNKTISFMQVAQDHKRAFDNDEGENTGGMGAYTPVKCFDGSPLKEGKEIIKKMVFGLSEQGTPFKGILYAGLMNTPEGVKTIEFNARFGDPETEVILKAMKSDLYEVIEATFMEKEFEIKWSENHFLGVVMASKGYPSSYKKGVKFNYSKDIFVMGAKVHDGGLISDGGRVAIAIGEGKSLKEAKDIAYKIIDTISNDSFFFRKDIGDKSIDDKKGEKC